MIKVNFNQKRALWINYIEELFSKGKRHVWRKPALDQYSVMTRQEMRRLVGFMLKDDKEAANLDFRQAFSIRERLANWLISGDAWDEKDLLDLLAEAAIDCYDEAIQTELEHKDKELAHFVNNEVSYG